MTTYEESGVSLKGAEEHVERIRTLVTATWGQNVIGGFGGFAAGVEIPGGYTHPVLMMSTDGVGTKLELARRAGLWSGVGFDLVAMCVDDLAATGALPIAFVDYLAVGRLDPSRDTDIVGSIAAACAEAGCALVGGETAEHPGVMDRDQVDLAGAALGVVERGSQVDGRSVAPGDQVIGILSPNLRSNGFSLVRRVLDDHPLDAAFPGTTLTWAEVVLSPSVIYAPAILRVVERVKAAAHITGGGLAGNLPRAIPDDLGIVIRRASWEPPPVFEALQVMGGIEVESMWSTFNMGVGFCLVVDDGDCDAALEELAALGRDAAVIGQVTSDNRTVTVV